MRRRLPAQPIDGNVPSPALSYPLTKAPSRGNDFWVVFAAACVAVCIATITAFIVGERRGTITENARWVGIKNGKVDARIAQIQKGQKEHQASHARFRAELDGLNGQIIGLLRAFQELEETADGISQSIDELTVVLNQHQAAQGTARRIINEIDVKAATL